MKKNTIYLFYTIQTMLFGLYLIIHKNVYLIENDHDIAKFLTHSWIAYFLILIGVIGFVSSIFKWKRAKSVILIFMSFFWAFFATAFFLRELQGYPNTDWILTLGEVATMFYLAKKE